MTDAAGAITYAQNYDPYGVVAQSGGASQTAYGYTGEYQDSARMVYLRARHYAPSMGRFLTRDTREGDYSRPPSLHQWAYVEGNPIIYTDPTGHLAMEHIIKSFGLSTVDQVLNMFRPGGILQEKWGYLAFLSDQPIGIRAKLWKETGRDYKKLQSWQDWEKVISRDNLSPHPCNVDYQGSAISVWGFWLGILPMFNLKLSSIQSIFIAIYIIGGSIGLAYLVVRYMERNKK